ncbi:GNAT family N-acetyltransferase [Dialister micraerophilus]|uniref:GNAT family N-acetyltransferase n=1 Tax=Dialister micraerophilus TaxID=309120 RepID=UPI00254E12D5|nr:GNAT family N-acetyltransferase [Dialister micraerophilus]MDK8285869.1 N-acetyltransferase family protein [Dialister micraerophilus]
MINLRYVEPEDSEILRDIYSYYVENTCITTECTLPDEYAFQKRVEKISSKYPYIVAERDGHIVGYIYASPLVEREAINHCVQISIYVRHGLGRSGVGKRMYRAIESVLSRMGITNMYARVAVPKIENEHLTRNSLQFHEYMGFTKVGYLEKSGYKFNQWFDLAIMEKFIAHHRDRAEDVRFFDKYPKPSIEE